MGKQGHGIGKGKPRIKDKGFGTALIRQQQIGVQGTNLATFLCSYVTLCNYIMHEVAHVSILTYLQWC